jgi:hypothetical protein
MKERQDERDDRGVQRRGKGGSVGETRNGVVCGNYRISHLCAWVCWSDCAGSAVPSWPLDQAAVASLHPALDCTGSLEDEIENRE